MFRNKNLKKSGASKGINETAIDLFASMTAVMLLIATVFFSTMTESRKKNGGKTKISDQYYLISFGYEDFDKEKEAIKQFENNINGILTRIGEHLPSLWKVTDSKITGKGLVINNINLLSKKNIFEALEENMRKTIEEENINNIVFGITDHEKIYINNNIISRTDFDNSSNMNFISINIEDTENFSLGLHLLLKNSNAIFPNLVLNWKCKLDLDCELIKDSNFFVILNGFYKCLLNDNIHNTLKVWLRFLNPKEPLSAQINIKYIIKYFFQLVSTKHLLYACESPVQTSNLVNSSNQINESNFKLNLNNNISKDSEFEYSNFKILNLSNSKLNWMSAKKNECLVINNGNLSFGECPVLKPKGINSAK